MRQTDKHMDVLKGRYKGYYKLNWQNKTRKYNSGLAETDWSFICAEISRSQLLSGQKEANWFAHCYYYFLFVLLLNTCLHMVGCWTTNKSLVTNSLTLKLYNPVYSVIFHYWHINWSYFCWYIFGIVSSTTLVFVGYILSICKCIIAVNHSKKKKIGSCVSAWILKAALHGHDNYLW